MDLVFEYIVPVTGMAAFFLGMLSRNNAKMFKILVLLALAGAFVYVKFFETSYSGGVLETFVGLYQGGQPHEKMAVHLAPIMFVTGHVAALIYKAFFYKEKVETMRERKLRVQAEYDFSKFD